MEQLFGVESVLLSVFEVCGICLQASRVEKHRVRLGCELERKRLNYQKRQERTGEKKGEGKELMYRAPC